MNLILGKKFQAKTICLPFNEKPNEKYLDMDVTIAGWGFTKVEKDSLEEDAGKLLLWFVENYEVNNLNSLKSCK